MYTNYFGFKEKPFTLVPNPSFLYLSSRHSLALTYLEYGIQENIGFVLLTGEVGTGKTTLIRHLLTTIQTSMEVAVISNTNVTSHELIKLILQELEIEPVSEHKSQNIDRLNSYLVQQYSKGKRVVLIIDEAQNLGREAIEEVRMLSNLSSDSNSLLQIILVGQPELRRSIQQNEFKQLAQRIAITYHLNGMDKDDVDLYIKHRIQQAKGEQVDLFDYQAVELIYKNSKGIPRIINTLCDACLVYAYADEEKRIKAEIVDQVIQDRETEWGYTEQSQISEEKTKDSAIVQDSENRIWTSFDQIRNDLSQLEFRVKSLEQGRLNQDNATKDELVSWLESRLKKAANEIKRLQEVNARQHKELKSLRCKIEQSKETNKKSETGIQESQQSTEETNQEQTTTDPSPDRISKTRVRRKIIFSVSGISLVALAIHLYLSYLV